MDSREARERRGSEVLRGRRLPNHPGLVVDLDLVRDRTFNPPPRTPAPRKLPSPISVPG